MPVAFRGGSRTGIVYSTKGRGHSISRRGRGQNSEVPVQIANIGQGTKGTLLAWSKPPELNLNNYIAC